VSSSVRPLLSCFLVSSIAPVFCGPSPYNTYLLTLLWVSQESSSRFRRRCGHLRLAPSSPQPQCLVPPIAVLTFVLAPATSLQSILTPSHTLVCGSPVASHQSPTLYAVSPASSVSASCPSPRATSAWGFRFPQLPSASRPSADLFGLFANKVAGRRASSSSPLSVLSRRMIQSTAIDTESARQAVGVTIISNLPLLYPVEPCLLGSAQASQFSPPSKPCSFHARHYFSAATDTTAIATDSLPLSPPVARQPCFRLGRVPGIELIVLSL
jgi:hypothetical protein